MARRGRARKSYTVPASGDGFVDAVMAMCEEQNWDVQEEALEAAQESGQRAAAELKARSRRSSGGGRHYADGWVPDAEVRETGVEVIVHNKTAPGLTHLLEKGHVAKNQYGTYGTVAGDGIIAKVADELGSDFEGRLRG